MDLPVSGSDQNQRAKVWGDDSYVPPGFRMKGLLPKFAVVLACVPMVWASSPATNTTVGGIRSLTRIQAEQRRPVVFEATVTYYRPQVRDLFVQQDGVGIYIA